MIGLLWVGAIAIATSLILTPIVRAVARRATARDRPSDSHALSTGTPRLGGLAIATTWVATLAAISAFGPDAIRTPLHSLPLGPILISALLVFAIGITDDVRPVSAGVKVAVEALAAGGAIGAGIIITHVTVFGSTINLGWMSVIGTLGWLIVITNAFNLVDGLDGLATGVAIIAGVTCTAIVMLRGDLATAVLLVALLGALVGFLPFNFNPASIVLGDGGSLFIGFVLALTAITGLQKGATALSAGVPLLIFALPLLDVVSAVIRRLRGAPAGVPRDLRSTLSRLLQPDRAHIHHRLLDRGLSHRSAVLFLYGVSIALAALALLTASR